MKCKNISNKINNFVVQNLKKFKLNGQTSSKMPAMPKDKTTAAITVVDNNIKYNNNNNNNNNCNNSKDNKLEENNLNNSANIENNSCNINKETTNKINNSIANGSSINNSSANNTAGSNGGGGGGSGGEGGTDISIKKRGVNDFRFGKAIGEGSFSTVYIAKDIHTNKEYAIKVCDKQHIFRENKNKYILIEREAMNTLSNAPGFVTLFCTFQCTKSLYFAMTYAKNGDLLPFINKVGSFDLECTKFYAAELVLALEEMHSRGIIHRDLKPENILLDDSMHVLITDFGSAKILPKDTTSKTNSNMDNSNTTNNCNSNENSANDNTTRARKYSFVGTAQYVSPELLKGEQSTISSDLWALGCIIYQMISGLPPFRSNIEYQIFQKIQKLDLTFPEGFDEVAKDLVTKLLVIDPKSRIGANDSNFRYTSIRDHKFFDNIEWDTLREQKPPQIYPYLPGDDLHSDYCVPDHLEPGLDDKQIQRLLDLELGTSNCCGDKQQKIVSNKKNIADLTETEKESRLRQQINEKYNCFCKGEVILKQGIVNKRKGLFARKRMLLLTSGPRLIYVDPVSMVKKGEIPWSPVLRVEPKNFKIFFIHTPNRTYYLEEPEGYALNWCRDIEDVRIFTYGNKNNS